MRACEPRHYMCRWWLFRAHLCLESTDVLTPQVVVIKPHEEGNKEHPYPFVIAAGIERYPRKVTRSMSSKKLSKRSKIKPFIKVRSLQNCHTDARPSTTPTCSRLVTRLSLRASRVLSRRRPSRRCRSVRTPRRRSRSSSRSATRAARTGGSSLRCAYVLLLLFH